MQAATTASQAEANCPGDVLATLVVCEGDEITRELLCDRLAEDRFAVMPAPDASAARQLCRHYRPDLLLVDQALPDGSALELLHEIREGAGGDPWIDRHLPVIVLCAAGRQGARLGLLDSGADDFVVKPFRYEELRARIGSLLRRCGGEHRSLRVGDLIVDLSREQVHVGGRPVALSRHEFKLLCVLVSEPTRVFSKQETIEAIWGHRSARARTLDAHASRLRRKLDPEQERFVVNCWGVGFKLLDD